METTDLLEEFRQALEQEIQSIKRSSASSAVPLVSGKLVSIKSKSYQYSFKLDSIINSPSGTPVELDIPKRRNIPATIISVDGMTLVLDVEEHLGDFISYASLKSDNSILFKKLIERIEEKGSTTTDLVKRMMSGTRETFEQELHGLESGQQMALKSALENKVTFIWGPPGTGKTHCIGDIANKLLEDESEALLIVSHTNTAVDGAIQKIAESAFEREGKLDESLLGRGKIIRVGQCAETLGNQFPEATLEHHVQKRSIELLELRKARHDEAIRKEIKIAEIDERLESFKILREIPNTISEFEHEQAQLVEFQNQLDRYEEQFERNEQCLDDTKARHKELSNALSLRKKKEKILGDIVSKKVSLGTLNERLRKGFDFLTQRNKLIDQLEEIEHLRIKRTELPKTESIKMRLHGAINAKNSVEKSLKITTEKIEDLKAQRERDSTLNGVQKFFRGAKNIEQTIKELETFTAHLEALKIEHATALETFEKTKSNYEAILKLDQIIAPYNEFGSLHEEQENLIKWTDNFRELESEKEGIEIFLNESHEKLADLDEIIRKTGYTEDELKNAYIALCNKLEAHKKLSKQIADLSDEIQRRGAALKRNVSMFGNKCLGDDFHFTSIENTISRLNDYISELKTKTGSFNEESLKSEKETLAAELKQLVQEISEIDQKIEQIQSEIVKDCRVLGCTLVKNYLADFIQERKFGTVILDEASMAPIPALWIAALQATKRLIIVGDFKQLPPIVISRDKQAKKWLGRDIFEVSKMKHYWESEDEKHPDNFVPLEREWRMNGDITRVANRFYYNLLKPVQSKDREKKFQDFQQWYSPPLANSDSNVMFINTKSLEAWASTVTRTNSTSRLNFISASFCVDFAEHILKANRSNPNGEDKRILIVSPYKPHAKLVQLMISSSDIIEENEVFSGTAHSFQGSEADVVIFDMVIDDPHWRARVFDPANDEDNLRLINVAITRAKHKLFVVGNLEFCIKRGKNAFLGKEFLSPLLENFPNYDAKEFSFSTNKLSASSRLSKISGSEIDLSSKRILMNQDSFYAHFKEDLRRAKECVVVYSAFITTRRCTDLMPFFKDAVERGVQVSVVTKPLFERGKRELEDAKRAEAMLEKLGVRFFHKYKMHEKVIFIDDSILWSGSLNPLSYSGTQELMERTFSKEVFENYFNILKVHEILITPIEQEICPVCGGKLHLAESPTTTVYWKCENQDCFSRNPNQPYPVNGELRCRTCDGRLEYGEWGREPSWRCVDNPKHRMKIANSHLNLPKMRRLIPKNKLHFFESQE